MTPSIKKLHWLVLCLTLGKYEFEEGDRMLAMLGNQCCAVQMAQGRIELRTDHRKLSCGSFTRTGGIWDKGVITT